MDNYFELSSDGKTIIAHARGGGEWDMTRIVKELNRLEDTRKRKGRQIELMRKREEKYQRLIGGLKAYIELEVNSNLWWDWNE